MTRSNRGAVARALLPSIVGLAASSAPVRAQTTPSDGTAVAERCQGPEHRQFDFWLGRWEVRAADGTLQGHNDIARAARGCALLEHWRGAGGGRGVSVNTYDAAVGRWTQRWVGDGATLWLEGGLENGSMVLRGTAPRATPRGDVLDRITWTPLPDGRVRQAWETSGDGGRTWGEIFEGFYLRASASFTEREASFRNGDVELRGTLMLPALPGRFPAVVFLHGSGPATRAGARPYAEEFAALGIASLFFDKRGSGSSGGSWMTSSLDDLAADALAAIRHLTTEPQIDAERIGLWGVSQAAWVATLAAAQSNDVAFMILISGGGASPLESERYSYTQAFERAGLTQAEKDEAWQALDAYFRYLATGEGRGEVGAGLATALPSRWYALAPLERILPSEENRHNWSWVATWDPAPHVEKLTRPILLMFGDRDAEQPTALAVERWRDGLTKAGNDNVTLMVFPGAGHGIRMGDAHASAGRAPFADGYAEAMLGWLWRHVVAPGR
jgi:uncharacterized protein